MQLISVNRIEYDLDKVPGHTYQWKAYTLNERGVVLDETEYDREGRIVRKNIFRDNKKGSLSEVLEYHSSDDLMERTEYEEDEEGLLTRIVTTYSDQSKLIKTFRYTDLGEAEEILLTDENGEHAGREIFLIEGENLTAIEFDADNNETHRLEQLFFSKDKIKEERKYYQTELIYKKLFFYNDKEQLEKTESWNSDEGPFEIEHFSYDEKGTLRELTKESGSPEGAVFERRSFNEKGLQEENQIFRDEMMVFQNKSEYDSESNLIAEEVFEIDWSGRITTHERIEHIYQA